MDLCVFDAQGRNFILDISHDERVQKYVRGRADPPGSHTASTTDAWWNFAPNCGVSTIFLFEKGGIRLRMGWGIFVDIQECSSSFRFAISVRGKILKRNQKVTLAMTIRPNPLMVQVQIWRMMHNLLERRWKIPLLVVSRWERLVAPLCRPLFDGYSLRNNSVSWICILSVQDVRQSYGAAIDVKKDWLINSSASWHFEIVAYGYSRLPSRLFDFQPKACLRPSLILR